MKTITKMHGAGLALGLACALTLLTGQEARAHGAEEHAKMAQALKSASTKADYKRSIVRYPVPDVVLTDYDEHPVKLKELLASGDPVMLNFIFTTCGTICPVMTKVFAEVPASLGAEGRKLRMISISIDPENDTPLQLKAYAKSFRAGQRWTFLTGALSDVKDVQRAFDSFRGDKMTHEPLTLMRQASAKDWIRIDGFASPDQLAAEFRKMIDP